MSENNFSWVTFWSSAGISAGIAIIINIVSFGIQNYITKKEESKQTIKKEYEDRGKILDTLIFECRKNLQTVDFFVNKYMETKENVPFYGISVEFLKKCDLSKFEFDDFDVFGFQRNNLLLHGDLNETIKYSYKAICTLYDHINKFHLYLCEAREKNNNFKNLSKIWVKANVKCDCPSCRGRGLVDGKLLEGPKTISKEDALKIAEKLTGQRLDIINVKDRALDKKCPVYLSAEKEKHGLWCVLYSMHPNTNILESSGAIMIDKETGEVVYNGSAGDEG